MYPTRVAATAGRHFDIRHLLIVAAMLLAFAALAYDAERFLATAVKAIGYPYQLDYGEGIVWQQAQQIRAGNAYGEITGFPAIVFHYPPLYHVIVLSIVELTGLDFLMVGRSVSVAATLLTGLFAGLISSHVAGSDVDRRAARLSGLIAGLITVSMLPVVSWAMLMRVDMVAMALSLAGVWLTMRAFSQPRLIILVAICFVAAVYTKQTAIAAPAAAFLTLLLVKPRTAVIGIATSAALGLAVLGLLIWATDGGFVRHIFLYNINRVDFAQLKMILLIMAVHAPYFAVVAIGLMQLRKRRPSLFHISRLREQLAITDGPACLLLLIIYLAFASVMVLAIAKVGSNINYLIEFVCVIAIFAGLACKDAADALIKKTRFNGAESFMLCVAVPAVVGAHALMMPARHDPRLERPPVGEMRQLVETVRQADRPVISDDMVLLKRAGKPVVWEPAIFAELASKGMWDSRPFIEMIRCQRFAFFVTQGVRGDALFNQRYDGAVADAMDRAYPIRRDMAGLVLHLPRGQACLVIKSTPRERT